MILLGTIWLICVNVVNTIAKARKILPNILKNLMNLRAKIVRSLYNCSGKLRCVTSASLIMLNRASWPARALKTEIIEHLIRSAELKIRQSSFEFLGLAFNCLSKSSKFPLARMRLNYERKLTTRLCLRRPRRRSSIHLARDGNDS